MPSRSMSGIRACGSKPPWRPSTYFIVARRTLPSRGADAADDAQALRAAEHLALDEQPLPAVGVDDHPRRARRDRRGRCTSSQMSTGSSTCPSASMMLVWCAPWEASLVASRLYDPPRASDSPDLSRHRSPDAVLSGPRTGETPSPGHVPIRETIMFRRFAAVLAFALSAAGCASSSAASRRTSPSSASPTPRP